MGGAPGVAAPDVTLEPPRRAEDPTLEGLLARDLVEPVIGYRPEERDGIVVEAIPELGIESAKERVDVWLPAPPEVLGEVFELRAE